MKIVKVTAGVIIFFFLLLILLNLPMSFRNPLFDAVFIFISLLILGISFI
jgi:hypothetical protein